MRVKICGLTRLADALLAASLGADAVGFVLWPSSPRAVRPDDLAAISRALPPFVTRVGVFVNAAPDEVARAMSAARLDAVQLHGEEDVAAYRTLGVPVLRAMTVETDEQVAAALALPEDVAVLVDAPGGRERGGTGRQADWGRAAIVAARRPIVLAGGLTPENVGEAIRTVRPWAVDVSSGVESAPGVKEPDRLRRFLSAAGRRQAEDA